MAGLVALGVISSMEKIMEASSRITSDILTCNLLTTNNAVDLQGQPDYTKSYTLTGKLQIKASRPITLREIRLKFKGSTKVGESKEGKIHPAAGFMARDESLMTVQRIEKIINEEPLRLSTGISEVPFSIDLPGDLPPSVYTKYGWLEYRLSAFLVSEPGRRLSQVFGRTFRVSKVIIVKRNFIRSLEIAPYMPTTRYKGKRADRLEYEFEVPRVVCKEQGQIEFSAKLKPLVPTARVKHILVRLDQLEEYRVISKDIRRPSPSQAAIPPLEELSRPATSEFEIDPNEPLSWEYPLTLGLSLDSPKIYHNRDTPLIDITHKLRVRMTFIESESPCWLSFPVIISSISDSEFENVSIRRSLSSAGNISLQEDGDDEPPTYQSLGPNPILPSYDMSNREIALSDAPPDFVLSQTSNDRPNIRVLPMTQSFFGHASMSTF